MAAGKVGTAVVESELDPTGVKKGLQQIEGETKRRMGGVGADIKKGFEKALVPATIAFAAIAVGAHKAIDAASDLNEQINKAGTVFGKSGTAIVKWSEGTAHSLGISQRAALEAAGTFGNMLVPMGIARDEAAKMSKRMVTLAADMASFNNASPEETLDAIRSGLAGETEPLRKYGVFLSAARVQQEALSSGLVKGADALKKSQAATVSATAAVAAAKRDQAAADKELAAATAANEAATKRLSAAEHENAAARSSVTKATAQLASAQDQAAKSTEAVGRATEGVRDSAERLADARARQAASVQKVKDAEQNLADSQARVKAAQQALTQARLDAIAALDNMRDSAKDAALGEQRSQIGLERARQRLDAVTSDSTSTELDRREAALSVAEAEQGLKEAQDKRAETAAQLNDAERKGVDGSKQVVAARKEIEDAQAAAVKSARTLRTEQLRLADASDSVRDAARGLATAQRNLRKAHGEAAQAASAVKTAQRELVSAQRDASASSERLQAAEAAQDKTARRLAAAKDADTKATDRVKLATDALTKARAREKAAQAVVTKGMTAEVKARATYNLILKDTKDQQGDVHKTAKYLANTQRRVAAETEDANAALGKGLLPTYTALNKAMEGAAKLAGKHAKATQILVGVFAALSGTIIAVNAAFKAYAAWQAISRAAAKLGTKETIAFTVAQKLQAAWLKITAAATKVYTAVQWLLNAALSANPIALVVIALAALVAGLVLAYTKSDTFRKIVDEAFRVVLDAAQACADFFTDDLPKAFEYVVDWLKKHWELAGLLAGPFGLAVAEIIKHWDDIKSAVTKGVDAVLGVLGGAAKDLLKAATGLGKAIVSGVVSGLSGIGGSAWGVIDNIGAVIGQYASRIIGWGTSVGTWIKNGLATGLTGIGNLAWDWINNIWAVVSSYAATIASWGAKVGGWIKSAVGDGLKGIGDLAWSWVNNIWTVLSEQLDTIKGWGAAVGNWIKQGVINGLKGLGKAIVKLLKRALPGPLEKAVGLIPHAVTPTPGPAAAAATAGVGATAAGGGGGLAGPAPLGYRMRRALAGVTPAAAAAPAPIEVRVFIGETELRGIVRTEVRTEDNRTAQTLLAGAAV